MKIMIKSKGTILACAINACSEYVNEFYVGTGWDKDCDVLRHYDEFSCLADAYSEFLYRTVEHDAKIDNIFEHLMADEIA